jgi:hypothetical protein
MTDVTKTEAQVEDEARVSKNFSNPYDFLATIKGAPSRASIESLKSQTPNNRLRVFSPEGKRVYIVRGISALELNKLQNQVSEKTNPEKAEQELHIAIAAACVVWTNQSESGRLTEVELRAGSAGLPVSLFELVSWLSDFIAPEAFGALSAEL